MSGPQRCFRALASYLSVALLATPLGVQGQELVLLQGEVLDAVTRLPVEGAMVVVSSSDRVVVTDELGYFALSGMPVGKTDVRVARIGYHSISGVAAEVVDGETWQIWLAPEAIELEGVTATVAGPVTRLRRESGHPVDLVSSEEMDSVRHRVGDALDVIRLRLGPRINISVGGGSSRTGTTVKFCIESTRRRPSIVELGEELGGCRPSLLVLDGVTLFDPTVLGPVGREAVAELNAQASQLLLSTNPEEIESIRFLQPMEARFRYGTSGKNGALLIETRRGREP